MSAFTTVVSIALQTGLVDVSPDGRFETVMASDVIKHGMGLSSPISRIDKVLDVPCYSGGGTVNVLELPVQV